ncbi:ABC transporter substrate-binding protein, partial [Klebsiella pneumoniae]|nr:ABC transporter substrate-binding protein [Klebsiella pneumoniae]
PEKLNDAQRAAFYAVQPKATPPMLVEPHAAWVDALEQEWLRRYGTH